MDLKILGNNIRRIRQMRGLTQENVANDLGCSLNTYTKIERGETNVPFMRLVQIATYLNSSVTALVQEEEETTINELAESINKIKDDMGMLQQTLAESLAVYKEKTSIKK